MGSDDTEYEDLLERWFAAQAVLTPMLKSMLATFQGEDHALLLLSRRAEGMSPTELMGAMGITPGRVSNLVRQLEKKGFAERSRGMEDMRSVLIRATPAGVARAEAAYAQVKDGLRAQFRKLGCGDARELVRIVEKLAEGESDCG